jgi:type II secretory pathway pseudopilin PulG
MTGSLTLRFSADALARLHRRQSEHYRRSWLTTWKRNMRRMLALLVSCTLASLVTAGDAPVILQITIADGPVLVQHFQAGTLGRMWGDPAMAPLKIKLDEVMPIAIETLGVSPLALPEALTSAQFTFFGVSSTATKDDISKYKSIADFQLRAGLGKLAPQIFSKLKEQGTSVEIPNTDEAFTFGQGDLTLVRIGEQLVMASQAKNLIPLPIEKNSHDLSLVINGQFIHDIILATMDDTKRPQAEAILAALHRFLVPVKTSVDIYPNHMTTQTEAQTTLPFMLPVDLSLCRRLPSTAYSVNAIGYDGKILWDDLVAPLLTAIAPIAKRTPGELLAQVDQQLTALGITSTLEHLIGSIRGITMVAQTPGAPLPAYTMAIPRSPGIDQAVSALMRLIGSEIPGEGLSSPIFIPNVPVPLNLICDTTHWVATSDPTLATNWTTTNDGGWLASPLGKLAEEKITKETFLLSTSDTAAELRAMQGYLSLMMGALPLEPKEKQAVMRGFSTLITNAGLSYEVMHQKDGHVLSDGSSMVGGSSIAVIAIIAAIAIPNLLESRVTANEAAAATTLKSGVFPAQVQFQAGGYRDLDKDNVGEYGFFSELSGGPIAGQANDFHLSLLGQADRWQNPLPELNGYYYAMYLADGNGSAFGVNDKQPENLTTNADAGERYFIAYSWPANKDNGRKAFAITSSGVVYTILATELQGNQPAWNTLFGGEGKTWTDEPVWQQHNQNNKRPRAQNAAPMPAPKATDSPIF